MKSQYLATKENAMVFDMIVAQADFDFGEQFTQMLNTAKVKLWRSVARNEGTVTAAWTTNKETLTTALQELDLWFMSK